MGFTYQSAVYKRRDASTRKKPRIDATAASTFLSFGRHAVPYSEFLAAEMTPHISTYVSIMRELAGP